MGVFDDKKFLGMDWLSQATEPIQARVSEVLEQLPDHFTVTYDDIINIHARGSYYSMSFDKHNIIERMISKLGIKDLCSNKDQELIYGAFDVQYSKQICINFETGVLEGYITLVKIKANFDDKELKPIMGHDGTDYLTRLDFPESDQMTRANEILELLGKCEFFLKGKSQRSKKGAIISRLTEIFVTDEWKIKDVELSNKICHWIADYIKSGDVAAFANFCKLKVMTHRGGAIYSVEEVQ
jgi:hypothetical protein